MNSIDEMLSKFAVFIFVYIYIDKQKSGKE